MHLTRSAGKAFVALLAVAHLAAQPPSRSRIDERTVFDSTYQRPRKVWVYTPPGYDARRTTSYPLVVAFDGWNYKTDTMGLPRALDSLLAAHAAPAFVALMVDNDGGPTRIADLGNAPRFANLMGNQLIPWLRAGWNVTRDPHRVIITGSSAGGLGSAYLAFTRPDLFGNVWSQSGAFWRGFDASNEPPYEWLSAQVAASPKRDVRFMLDVGDLESRGALGGAAPSIRDANRHLRDALREKGYEVTYLEVPGGNHAEQWWKPRLPVGIAHLSQGWPQ